jgi:hypothetical protein
MQKATKILAALLLFLAPLGSHAQELQLDNAGFENWGTHSTGHFEIPAGGDWAPYISTIIPSSPFIVTGKKSTDAYSGSYALQLSPSTPDGSSAQLLRFENEYISFEAQPSHLTGYFKYESSSNDAVTISVELMKAESHWNIVIAQGSYTISDPSVSYIPFELPLFYYNDTHVPDSLKINIQTVAGKTNSGTNLWIDDLKFSYEPLILTSNISAMSNTHLFHIEKGNVNLIDNHATAHWHLYDLAGQTLKTTYNSTGINFGELPEGIYLMQVQTSEGATHLLKVVN